MTALDRICTDKLAHIEVMKHSFSVSYLQQMIGMQAKPRGFCTALTQVMNRPSLIAEIKQASPSGGMLCAGEYNPADIAEIYQESGAACLSVLTDGPWFQGRDEDLIAAQNACTLPVLRKDFMLDTYQITESRALGADCILIIMAAVDDARARDLFDAAKSYDMDCLVEVHDEGELDRAIALGADMIGVNSRNLKTLEVNLHTAITLAASIPDTIFKIAESGIKTHDDIKVLQAAGYKGFLVGESLMRQPDIGMAVKNLLNGT